MEPYRRTPASLPVTEALSSRVVVLPTGAALSEEAVGVVSSIIAVAMNNGAEIRRELERAG